MADFTPVTQLNAQAQAGWDAQQAEARKAAAYNALRRTYGDIAGDPEAALALQKQGFNEQNNPLIIQGNQLQNQGAQQKIDYDTQQNPQLIEHQQLANEGQQITNDANTATGDVNKSKATQAQYQVLHGVFSGALNGLATDAANVTDPTQLGTLFDNRVAQISKATNRDPAQVAAQLASERDAFTKGGAAAIPQMQKDVDGLLTGMQSPEAAAKTANQNAQAGKNDALSRKADADAAKATAAIASGQSADVGKVVKTFNTVYGSPDKLAGEISAANVNAKKFDSMLGTGATLDDKGRVNGLGKDGLLWQTRQLAGQLKGESKAQLLAQSKITGTPEYQLQQNLDQIKHSAALTDLQNMRANGLSMGRVTNTEFGAAAGAFINADITAATGTLVNQIDKLADVFKDTQDASTKRVGTLQKTLDQWGTITKGTPYDISGGVQAQAGTTGVAPQGGGAPVAGGSGIAVPPAQNPQAGPVSAPVQSQAPQQGQVGTAPDGTPIVQASAPVQQAPTARLVPNFVAAPTDAPLQQALSDPSARANLPAGMRNNNPGNIKFAHQAGTTPSVNTDEGDPQAVYASPQAGMDAMASLAGRKYAGGKTTADQIIAGQGGWTPNNHAAAANVARTLGIGPNDDLQLNDPVKKAQFMRALILQEHGPKSRLYPDSMIYAAAGAGGQQSPISTAAAAPQSAPQQQNAMGGQQPQQAADGSPQLMAGTDNTPAPSAPARGAQATGEAQQQLATMSPMQVATQPVSLPSAANLTLPATGNQAQGAGGQKFEGVTSASDILAKYGLKRKTA